MKYNPKIRDKDDPYLPDEGLLEAVNLAIFLKRPLLIQGEPGCGKTKLAKAIAYSLYRDDYQDHFFEWHVKSTDTAADGLYTFDHLARLRDAQLAGHEDDEAMKRTDNRNVYVKYGPLGKAFQSKKRAVVLIDEIDKADLDFPNDLLLELEEKRFLINEVPNEDGNPTEISSPKGKEPIIIITSNNEKQLPNAFLRRCNYYRLKFPDTERLAEILESHYKAESSTALKVAESFVNLRKEIEPHSDKKISTSELMDWYQALNQNIEEHLKNVGDIKNLPFTSVLLKSMELRDWYDRNSSSDN
jgi:MoxR-like ATPase